MRAINILDQSELTNYRSNIKRIFKLREELEEVIYELQGISGIYNDPYHPRGYFVCSAFDLLEDDSVEFTEFTLNSFLKSFKDFLEEENDRVVERDNLEFISSPANEERWGDTWVKTS